MGGAGHVCDPLCEYILIVLMDKVTHSNDFLSLPQILSNNNHSESLKMFQVLYLNVTFDVVVQDP